MQAAGPDRKADDGIALDLGHAQGLVEVEGDPLHGRGSEFPRDQPHLADRLRDGEGRRLPEVPWLGIDGVHLQVKQRHLHALDRIAVGRQTGQGLPDALGHLRHERCPVVHQGMGVKDSLVQTVDKDDRVGSEVDLQPKRNDGEARGAAGLPNESARGLGVSADCPGAGLSRAGCQDGCSICHSKPSHRMSILAAPSVVTRKRRASVCRPEPCQSSFNACHTASTPSITERPRSPRRGSRPRTRTRSHRSP